MSIFSDIAKSLVMDNFEADPDGPMFKKDGQLMFRFDRITVQMMPDAGLEVSYWFKGNKLYAQEIPMTYFTKGDTLNIVGFHGEMGVTLSP